jgi:thioredoxin reductase (NADPH)
VESVVVRDLISGRNKEVVCSGVFPYVALKPKLDYLKLDIARDRDGFVLVDDNLCSSVSRVFAAGAVRAGFGGLLSDAVADANRAAANAVNATLSSEV